MGAGRREKGAAGLASDGRYWPQWDLMCLFASFLHALTCPWTTTLTEENRPPDLTPQGVRAALNLRPMVVRMPATTLEPDTFTQRMHLESLPECGRVR